MTHSNDAQCRPVRLDQYVNHDPRLIFKTRLVFKARLLFEEIRLSECQRTYTTPDSGFTHLLHDLSPDGGTYQTILF